MLSPAEYEAIGRFTSSFNNIEETLTLWLGGFIGVPEVSVAEWIIKNQGMFESKRQFAVKLLKLLVVAHPSLDSKVTTVLAILERASLLAKERNEQVHAVVNHNFIRGTTTRQHKGAEKPCDVQALTALSEEASELAKELFHDCLALYIDLDDLRLKTKAAETA